MLPGGPGQGRVVADVTTPGFGHTKSYQPIWTLVVYSRHHQSSGECPAQVYLEFRVRFRLPSVSLVQVISCALFQACRAFSSFPRVFRLSSPFLRLSLSRSFKHLRRFRVTGLRAWLSSTRSPEVPALSSRPVFSVFWSLCVSLGLLFCSWSLFHEE